jgi:hypothetical protein
MLAVIDHLTGWAEVYPIPDKRSETVWKKLNSEFFPRFGFPEVLISDQGQEYNSNAFRDGLRLLGINHKRTTPGHPETNGLAERFHRTLKETLRKLCNNRSSQWEEQLGNALWAYRASEMETRGSSPYYLLFGQIPNGPSSQIQNETRFDTLARAQRHCYDLQEKAKQYRQSHSTLPHNRAVAIGDMITINCAEPVTLSHLRDHSFRVVSVRGKVIGYVPVNTDRPGRVRYINVNRVRVVPDDITWADVQPRSRRNRTDVDVRTWTATHQPPSLPEEEDAPDEPAEVDDRDVPEPMIAPPPVEPAVAQPAPQVVYRRSLRIQEKSRREIDLDTRQIRPRLG